MSSNSALDRFGQAVDASPSAYVDSYEIAGIDPDYHHLTSGGYHVPREKLPTPWSDYSSGLRSANNSNPRDLGGSAEEACAIDMAFDDADMVAVTQALIDAAERGDPRMACVREFNGTVNNRTTLNRDHELGWRQNYLPNSSHLRHVHIGFYRDVAGDWNAIKGVVDIVTHASSGTTTQGGTAAPVPSEEDWFDMATKEELKAVLDEVVGAHVMAAMQTGAVKTVLTNAVDAVATARRYRAIDTLYDLTPGKPVAVRHKQIAASALADALRGFDVNADGKVDIKDLIAAIEKVGADAGAQADAALAAAEADAAKPIEHD